jgi:hypothetical protein
MPRTRITLHAPSRGRRAGRFGGWVRNEEARRCRFPGRKAQAARRCQFCLVENADDGGEALSPEPFFDRIQSFAGSRRLDDDEARRIET